MALRARSFMKKVTWITKVHKKKAKFRSILNFNECKKKKTYAKKKNVVPKKMDPYYSSRGLS